MCKTFLKNMNEKGINKKAVFVDTNSINENGSLKIHELIVNNMGLQKGEKVTAYQEEDSWEAEIVYEDNCWGVRLLSDLREVSKERQEGNSK